MFKNKFLLINIWIQIVIFSFLCINAVKVFNFTVLFVSKLLLYRFFLFRIHFLLLAIFISIIVVKNLHFMFLSFILWLLMVFS